MSKLCSNCYFIGRGKNGVLNGSFVMGAIFVGIGMFGLTNKDYLFGTYSMWVAANTILIGLGIIKIVEHFVGGKVCPKCSNKPMLAVNTPQAIKLIKAHEFNFGENSKADNSQNPKA